MRISIVIPLYNKEQHILDTLECIQQQSFQNYEIIIVDDGSTDNSLKIVKEYKDPRIKIISQTNAGAAAARNRGVNEATSNHVAFMDADDRWENNYLETMVSLIELYPEAIIYGSNYKIIENGEENVLDFPGIIQEKGYLSNYFISGKIYTPLWTSAVIVRKDAFLKLGGFPLECKVCEDIDLWCRMAAIGKVAYINIPLAIYVRDSSNMLSKSKDASYFFPFLKNYKYFFEKTDSRLESVENYIVYRKFLAASSAIFISHNRKEAKQILKQLGFPKGYICKAVFYRIFLCLPNRFIQLYCLVRLKYIR